VERTRADYYVDGGLADSDTDRKSHDRLFTGLRPFESEVTLEPGDKVVIRGGVYDCDSAVDLSGTTGTAHAPIVFEPYRFERPVFDFSAADSHGLILDRSQHTTIRDLEIRHADEHNVRVLGNADGSSSSQNALGVRIENCVIHGHGAGGAFGHGVLAAFGADRTLVRGCEIYDGSSGGNSDGLHFSHDSRNTVIERTVCHHNSDDGIDFGAGNAHDPRNPATLRRVSCYRNGTNLDGTAEGDGTGFKTGDCNRPAGGHTLTRCVAFDNTGRGIGSPCTDVPLTLHNCTAVKNRGTNIYATAHAAHELVNCISQSASSWDLVLSPQSVVENCNWDDSLRGEFNAETGTGVEVAFQSSKPNSCAFLRPTASSTAVDAGTRTAVQFTGEAPDWGAFEVWTDHVRRCHR
jgi:hypothetical protein